MHPICSNSKNINNETLSQKCLSFLKEEITETEYNFIKDKLLYSDKTISPDSSAQFDNVSSIIMELYGQEMGNKILKKLHDKLNLLGSDQ